MCSFELSFAFDALVPLWDLVCFFSHFLLLLTNWNFTTGPGNRKDSCYLIRLMVSYLTSIFWRFWWDFLFLFLFLFHRNLTLIQTWPILRGIFLIIKLLFSKIWPDINLIDPDWLLLFVSASYALTVDEDSNLYGDKNISFTLVEQLALLSELFSSGSLGRGKSNSSTNPEDTLISSIFKDWDSDWYLVVVSLVGISLAVFTATGFPS